MPLWISEGCLGGVSGVQGRNGGGERTAPTLDIHFLLCRVQNLRVACFSGGKEKIERHALENWDARLMLHTMEKRKRKRRPQGKPRSLLALIHQHS